MEVGGCVAPSGGRGSQALNRAQGRWGAPCLRRALAVRADVSTEFHFDVEDFLFALCSLCSELVSAPARRMSPRPRGLRRPLTPRRWGEQRRVRRPPQARLAVNSVIAEDYNRPLVISRFVSELYAGFQLLNLKNDGLRKRFDGIKYDIKKIEEVVYDISIRGLARPVVA